MTNKLVFNLIVPDALEAMNFYEQVFDAIRGDIFEFSDKKT